MSLLYLTGYLTRVRSGELRTSVPEGMMALKIPNAEIQEIFETTVQTWFADSARVWDRRKLFEAVWSGDVKTLTKEMNTLLRTTISYHDYGEDFYHAFLAGILRAPDIRWSRTGSMEKDAAMWLFLICVAAGRPSLRQNVSGSRSSWKMDVWKRSARSGKKDMSKTFSTAMMRCSVLGLPFIRNGVWSGGEIESIVPAV